MAITEAPGHITAARGQVYYGAEFFEIQSGAAVY
jgi:hypothetical protein